MAVTPESPAFPHAEPIIGDGASAHADHDAAAYQRGSMTIEEQGATYSLFMNMAKYGSLVIAAVLLMLTLWFMPNGTFIGGVIAFVVMLAAGIFFLRGGKSAH